MESHTGVNSNHCKSVDEKCYTVCCTNRMPLKCTDECWDFPCEYEDAVRVRRILPLFDSWLYLGDVVTGKTIAVSHVIVLCDTT